MTLQLFPTGTIVYHPTLTLTPTQPLSQIYTVSPICTMCLVLILALTLTTLTVLKLCGHVYSSPRNADPHLNRNPSPLSLTVPFTFDMTLAATRTVILMLCPQGTL